MLTVAEGVQKAKDHLNIVLPESNFNLQLEELETAPFSSKWSFVFSATSTLPDSRPTLTQLVAGRRVAKSVEIDSETGALISVKNVAA